MKLAPLACVALVVCACDLALPDVQASKDAGGPADAGNSDASIVSPIADASSEQPPTQNHAACIAVAAHVIDPTSGHCYARVDGSRDWPAARDACAAQSAHLVTITSAEEAKVLEPLLRINSAGTVIWIGASDIAKEGTFAWVTGEPFVYTQWRRNPDEPNGQTAAEDCVDVYSQDEAFATWNDANCTTQGKYICEFE